MGNAGLKRYLDNLKFVAEAKTITLPPPPAWATANRVRLDLDTMTLRDFSRVKGRPPGAPVLIDPPMAGHSSTIADYARGQSLVETLLDAGVENVVAADWKAATDAMKNFDIDRYLAEINVVVDELGGAPHLIGLCQGGWMSAMYAARFPGKVRSLVLAGAPIDTAAGDGEIKKMAHRLPTGFYETLVAAGNGRMLGAIMLAGWKNMHPENQFEKYIDLYGHIDDTCYVRRAERFAQWYENPLDLPGRYYLQAIDKLFKRNEFAKGNFVGLGHTLSLKAITVPVYLIAGETDDITPKEQVFNAAHLLGTPAANIERREVPGGHIGLFMGTRTLADVWPDVGHWIRDIDRGFAPTSAHASHHAD
ncbi:MAG TPA: alpha/beta fold hydrolase [Casimicrobiaceae bacterium]